jgi:7-carboxy-7-deazaguanine synthase
MSIDKVLSIVRSHKIKYVCITGGEPLLQEEVYPLIYELQRLGCRVSIETSGCVPLESCSYNRSYKYVMDIKCPSSGVSQKNILDNLFLLLPKDEVKFVIADEKDYLFAKNIIKKYQISGSILFSPVFDKNMKPVIGQELINWLIRDELYNVRLQCQLHKVIGVK